jgi:hypothetical protein
VLRQTSPLTAVDSTDRLNHCRPIRIQVAIPAGTAARGQLVKELAMRPKFTFGTVFAVSLLLQADVAVAAQPPVEPAQVMLVGMFHFANPGRDMVKSRVINVMTPANQAYLDGLSTRIAKFRPTDVLAECSPADQAEYDQEFLDYVDGRFELPSNETYQIGFRVAKVAGLSGVICFDEDVIGWNSQPLFDYMDKQQPQTKLELEAMYKSLSESDDKEQSTLSLAQLLQLANDPARDAINKGLYVRTNDVDAGGGFAGADASASWWHRNFRMYANIQKVAAPGRRVVALGGQGHTAILKDLLAVDSLRKAEDIRGYLDVTPPSP